MKHQDIFELFIRINIDADPETKTRPQAFYEIQNVLNCKIAEIPTIIVDNGKYILTGAEAFKWLEYQISLIEKEKELTAFNPIEMGSFSDSYACYGSNDLNNATEQCFKFIGKPDEKINTPQETSGTVSKEEYNRKQNEREQPLPKQRQPQQMQQHPQQMMQQMSPQMMSPQQMQQHQFNNMYKSQLQRNGKISNKQKDFDQKLQQMMMERESLEPPSLKVNPNMIDFQTGQMNF